MIFSKLWFLNWAIDKTSFISYNETGRCFEKKQDQ